MSDPDPQVLKDLGTDPDLDLDLLRFLQSLTPWERLLRHEAARELVQALRAAYHATLSPEEREEIELKVLAEKIAVHGPER